MAKSDNEPVIILGNGPSAGPTGNSRHTTASAAGISGLAGDTIVIDPDAISGSVGNADGGGSGPVKRKRGRPAGSGGTAKTKGPPIDINGLEFILLSAHEMLAGMTQIEELEIDKEEAGKLSLAIANVGRHYNMAMSAKALDWTALFMTLGAVYGTRIAAIRIRRTMAKDTAKTAPRPASTTPSNVTPITPKPSAAPQQPNGPLRTINIPGLGTVEVPQPGAA